jgi:hypothetical protein
MRRLGCFSIRQGAKLVIDLPTPPSPGVLLIETQKNWLAIVGRAPGKNCRDTKNYLVICGCAPAPQNATRCLIAGTSH